MTEYNFDVEKARQELTGDDILALETLKVMQSTGGAMIDHVGFFEGFSDKALAVLARESQKALKGRIRERFGEMD
jgi:hypothetical protein